MKNLILITIAILVLGTTYAQETNLIAAQFESLNDPYAVRAENVEIPSKSTLNSAYLKKSMAQNNAKEIIQMEMEAATYELKNASIYDTSEASNYTLVLKCKRGKLIATYNNEGEILRTNENYKNIVIPLRLRIAISKEYSGWSFGNNRCRITYTQAKGIQKTYKIEMIKGKLRKTLKIDGYGNKI